MICVIRTLGEADQRTAPLTLERDGMAHVIKSVPTLIRDSRGEQYLAEQTSKRLLAAQEAAGAGALVDVSPFVAA